MPICTVTLASRMSTNSCSIGRSCSQGRMGCGRSSVTSRPSHHSIDMRVPIPSNGPATPLAPNMPELKTCIGCHTPPGVYSVVSMQRALGTPDHQLFRTYDWDVEMNYTVGAKVKQFDWGLLEGKLEVK